MEPLDSASCLANRQNSRPAAKLISITCMCGVPKVSDLGTSKGFCGRRTFTVQYHGVESTAQISLPRSLRVELFTRICGRTG
jgi:hypothetical protein